MEQYIEGLLDWTLDASWRLVVLTLLVLLAQSLFSRVLSARGRYAIWLALLIGMVSPFIATIPVVLPADMPIFDTQYPAATRADASISLPSLPAVATGASRVEAPAYTLRFRDVWTWGCALFVVVALFGVMRLSRMTQRGTLVHDPIVLKLLEECKAVAKVRRNVSVISGTPMTTPAVCGIWRPLIILPIGMLDSLPRKELKLVLLHELAHVKHHDYLMNLMLLPFQCLHWWNPIAWLALNRLRADRELARDAWVLARIPGDGRTDYGQLLLRLMEYRPRLNRFAPAAGILEGKQGTRRRLTMIKHFHTKRRPWLAAALVATLTAAALLNVQAAEEERSPFVLGVGSAWQMLRDTAGPAYKGSCSPHTPEYYEKTLSWTQPGETLYLLFAFDQSSQQTPDEYMDLLPIPYDELVYRAQEEQAVRLTGEARGLHIVVLAAATEKDLKKLIIDDPFLEDACARAGSVTRPHHTASDPNRPNIYIFDPMDNVFSVWEEVTWIVRNVQINKFGRHHGKEHYDRLFDGTIYRGDVDFMVIALALDSEDRVPVEYQDMLPEPWPVLESRLRAGEWLELTAERRGITVLLLATPEKKQLQRLIRRSEILADFADQWEEAPEQFAHDPEGPNIFIMEPKPTQTSQEHLFQAVIDLIGPELRNRTGRTHSVGSYAGVFDGTHNRTPGDLFVMFFSLDTPERIPEGYEDLLPMPWEEIEADLRDGRQVTLFSEARDVRTTLLAAPTRGELAPMADSLISAE